MNFLSPIEPKQPGRSFQLKLWLLTFMTFAAAGGLACLPRIPQNPAYHHFADDRTFLGVNNALNVLSNLPFLIVGAAGLWKLIGSRKRIEFLDPRERWLFAAFFAGAALVSLGSAWYHLAPDNERLVGDRLPMALGFMGLVAALLAERISGRLALFLFPGLLALGLGSVLYWHYTEQRGTGDLRPYAFVQFFPAIFLPLLLGLFPARYTCGPGYLGVIGFYAAAKIAEATDRPVFALGHVVSGHTRKHLFAAASVAALLWMLLKRRPFAATIPA